MRTLRVSVRRLVEFLLRSGDIDAGSTRRVDVEAMLAGSAIHRTLQAAAGPSYQAEVPLTGSIFFPGNAFSPHAARLDIGEGSVAGQEGFFLRIEGRADGIIDDGTHPLIIDEIKGVSRDVSAIDAPEPLHEAQALCYAYLHLRATKGPATLASGFSERVVLRVTYASMTTGEVRQVERAYLAPDIEARLFSLLEAAQRWAAWRVAHDELRERSLSTLTFPFEPRGGQRDMMEAVAATIHEGGRLYVQAPTGSGKTAAALHPALRALGSGEASRVAYLTAKTPTRQAALKCLALLRQQGLAANVLVMTARDKICPLRGRMGGTEVRSRPLASLCNPLECPFARGHLSRANDALFEAITTSDVLDAAHMGQVAARHHLCPYELQRDAARWADVIVCDYHYAFAPSAGLFGLTDLPGDKGAIYLVDEAHNLADRMREQYSVRLSAAELRELGRLLRSAGTFPELAQAVRATIAALPTWGRALPAGHGTDGRGREARAYYQRVRVSDDLDASLSALSAGMDAALELLSPQAGQADGHATPANAVELILALRDMGMRVRMLLGALQRAAEGPGYVTFVTQAACGGTELEVFCVDPSHDLDQRLEQARAAVFFSATLLPLDYHRRLLAARDEDASLAARSGFDPRNLRVLIASDVSARYARRGPDLYARVAAYVTALVRARPGNHLVFLPSYALVDEVAKALAPLADRGVTVVRQRAGMREAEREAFLARFRERHAGGTSLVGLCVLGGIFGEGIDLPGEALVGVVVVGTGMPRASAEREVIRDHFDARTGKGFAYAYTYPGMTKVLQAAGRLIRTEQDRGVVLLLDDRFLQNELREAFPAEWQDVRTCTLETVGDLLPRA